MTGFHGQKFDFTGEDGEWYCLLSDLPAMHLNMRVTSPVPDLPDITYITGLSVLTTDGKGVEHSIIITVKDPHSLESSCLVAEDGSVPPCLADNALSVVLDGEEGALTAPGTAVLAPDVMVDVVNLPGACRSFGFEKVRQEATRRQFQRCHMCTTRNAALSQLPLLLLLRTGCCAPPINVAVSSRKVNVFFFTPV